MREENRGPAERIIQTVLSYTDHAHHGRPGSVVLDRSSATGVSWKPVTHVEEGGQKVVYRLDKVGKKTTKTKLGTLRDDDTITEGGRTVGRYQPAGLFQEVVAWMYKQVAEVFSVDNEFAARWASYAYTQDNKDLKCILAAFMLVQNRRGDPVREGEKIAFHDEDYRDVGEAMCLLYKKDGKDLNPKMLLRIHEILSLPEIAKINRELGFGNSPKKPFLGRWPIMAEKFLRYREENPKLLEGLVKAGFRKQIMLLAQLTGYKPSGPKFAEILRWKQKQAEDGRRTVGIGAAVKEAEVWVGLSEAQICEKIVKDKPNFKRISSLLPNGWTRAVAAAAVEAGSFSDKELVIFSPTLEELGLLQDKDVKARWEAAVKKAEDMRAANIATRVKSKETKEKLQEGAETALKKAVEVLVRAIRLYVIVDVSGSMSSAIEAAKVYVSQFLPAFPLEQLHVSVFNTSGREVKIPHASKAGVEVAFKGIRADGGTSHGEGVKALSQHRPKPDEDALFIFIGDEEESGHRTFETAVQRSGLNPVAFGLVRVGNGDGRWVQKTAAQLGIPCLMIDERTFADPYAIPQKIRALIAATPVGIKPTQAPSPRVTIIDTILATKLLSKPAWAS